MFKLITFESRAEKQKILLEIKTRLEKLPTLISEIKNFEVGINFFDSATASDMVLISDFETNDALNQYRIHPEHVKFVDFFSTYKADGTVVDYEY